MKALNLISSSSLCARLFSISSSHYSSNSTFPRAAFCFHRSLCFALLYLCMAHRPCRWSVFNHQNRFSTESKIDWSALIRYTTIRYSSIHIHVDLNINLLPLCFLLLRLFCFEFVTFDSVYITLNTKKLVEVFVLAWKWNRCSRIAYLTLSISHGKKFASCSELNCFFAKK